MCRSPWPVTPPPQQRARFRSDRPAATRQATVRRHTGLSQRHTGPANFFGDNPKFCRSALALYPPGDFIDLLRRHAIGHHEKHKGQLFCDRSAQDLITMLLTECGVGGVTH